jgi:N-acetylmuramoyl-L-alanine amidase
LKHSHRIQGALRWSAAVFTLLLAAMAAQARVHRSGAWADAQFAAAERLQEALEGRPLESRTRNDYERVINAYRRIYFGAPSSGRAGSSVVATAQITEEMGRRFNDPDISRLAIQHYEFLRREYPGSRNRFDALFRIAEIYKDDLHDQTRADRTFAEFLRRYPRNQFAEAARRALAESAQLEASLKSKEARNPNHKDSGESKSGPDAEPDADRDRPPEDSNAEAAAANGKPARVIGVRHWSTPDYTRVAIDLEQSVKYESERIEHPDRVFFDLLDTQLDPKLAGKTFAVDDGLLRDIRASQFKAGRTRIVLDLDQLSEFDASLLLNPPRLIIDVHHRAGQMPVTKEAASIPQAAEDENLPNKAGPDSIANHEESLPPERTAVEPVRRRTVIVSNGLKKTIVDADDDEPEIKEKETLAKLESPDLDPEKIDAGKIDAGKVRRPIIGPIPDPPSTYDVPKGTGAKSKRKTTTADLDIREAQPTASGDRSLIRALGLKIRKIVIDPGHGGHDTGTIGPTGLEEKDLVLDVSRRLGKLLETRLGAEVIYTRKDDTFIPLETRTAIANQEAADLFVSVHANSSRDPDARGVETYYLNFTSSPQALEVAARENAVSEKSIHELQDLVKKIALKEKIEESQEFASDVQSSLHSGLAAKSPGVRDRGVKKAPFIVLIGANMPSILAEISFVSNPGDERRLETADYRQKIAQSLYRGIAKYVGGLSGVKVASKIDKSEGQ